MPVLDNPKHEAFAQKVATGMTAAEAYRKSVGSSGRSASVCGSRLLSKVDSRVKEIQGGVMQKSTHMTIDEKREFLALVKRTPIGEIDESSPLCQAVKYITTETGESREFKMVDKLKAIQLDNELAGHVQQAQQSINITNTVNVAVMTEEKRNLLLARKRNAITRRRTIDLLPDVTALKT